MVNITLKQLEVFVAVVENGGFSKAALRLYMAQSTVSGHINSLEKELGVLLFRRSSKRKVQVTELGKRIYQNAKKILDMCKALEDEILIDKTNEITIGASTVPAACIVPRLLASFARSHPEARFTVKKGDSGDIHQMLAEGEIQLAFVGSSIQHQAHTYEVVAEDHIVLIAPAREPYLSYHEKQIWGKELLTHPLLFRELGSGTQKVIDSYLAHIGMDKNRLHVIGRFESSATIISMVERGMGLALISDILLACQPANDKILKFEIDKDHTHLSRAYYMLSRKNMEYSNLHKAFMAHVKALTARPEPSTSGENKNCSSE